MPTPAQVGAPAIPTRFQDTGGGAPATSPMALLLADLHSLVKSLEAARDIPVEIPINLLASEGGESLIKWVEKTGLDAVNRALS